MLFYYYLSIISYPYPYVNIVYKNLIKQIYHNGIEYCVQIW